MRLSVAASVTVCVNSCRSTCDQLNVPIVSLPLRGDTSAITRPVLAPTVPIHGEPVVRTLNASCVGKTSINVFTSGCVFEVAAHLRVNALQVIAEILGNDRVLACVVHHDEVIGFLVREGGHVVEQPHVVRRRQVERVELAGLLQHLARRVLVAALRVEQPQPIAGRRPPRGALDGDLVLLRRPRVLPHRAELLGHLEVRAGVVGVELLDLLEHLRVIFSSSSCSACTAASSPSASRFFG